MQSIYALLGRAKVAVVPVLTGSFLFSASGASHAAYITTPAEVTAFFGEITTTLPGLIDEFWPVILTIVGAFLVMKVFKRFISRV